MSQYFALQRIKTLTARNRLVLLHTMDPRGLKLGGIETHVRLVLARHPETVSVLFVGIDETGDLKLGQIVSLEFGGRPIDFLPVAHVPAEKINKAAKTIGSSTTFRYALGLLRYIRAIRRGASILPVSCEIERFEFAIVPKLLRLPFVVIVHNEGSSQDEMDSLLKRYWTLHLLNERVALMLADYVFAVNASIAKRIAALSRRLGEKTEVMSVSVDTERFVPSSFDVADDAFHICFAGRLDAFKDPPLMFETLAGLYSKLAEHPAGRFRRVVFDYVGASDPRVLPSFAAIAEISVLHGSRAAPEVANIMRRAHAGIITSFFEGLPCYMLEMLASGRPVGAISLPQFAPLIVSGVTGFLVARQPKAEASAELLVDAFFDLACAIDSGRLDPEKMAAHVRPYSVKVQMHRLFARHEVLAQGVKKKSYRSESINST